MKKHALVIGGTHGTGKETVRMFLESDHAVSIISRGNHDREAFDHENVKCWRADLQNSESLREALRVIVSERGLPQSLAFFQRYRGDEDTLTGEFNVGVQGTRRVIETLVLELGLQDCAIVVITSVASHLIATPATLGYHIAKSSLRQLVRYYAATLGNRNIRVNAVSPGSYIKEESASFFNAHPELVNMYKKITPLGRMGLAQDVANLVDFLCGNNASFITGQEIVVDGGMTLRTPESVANELLFANHQ